MMTLLFGAAAGFVIGLFIPSPLDTVIRAWLKAVWRKIFSKVTEELKD